MTVQEAYNKGLTDSENNTINVFLEILKDPESEAVFQNPNMEIIKDVIKRRSDYHWELSTRVNNTGKGFKVKLEKDTEDLDNIQL